MLASLLSRPCRPPPTTPHASSGWPIPWAASSPASSQILVLLDANPLEDIRNTQKIRAVVADGRPYRRADLDRLLAEVELLNQKVEKQEKE